MEEKGKKARGFKIEGGHYRDHRCDRHSEMASNQRRRREGNPGNLPPLRLPKTERDKKKRAKETSFSRPGCRERDQRLSPMPRAAKKGFTVLTRQCSPPTEKRERMGYFLSACRRGEKVSSSTKERKHVEHHSQEGREENGTTFLHLRTSNFRGGEGRHFFTRKGPTPAPLT